MILAIAPSRSDRSTTLVASPAFDAPTTRDFGRACVVGVIASHARQFWCSRSSSSIARSTDSDRPPRLDE
jgi:hypothetical protein